MALGIGAGGIVGIALETTSGTYLAPTDFIPVNSESLKYDPDMQERAPIRNTPGLVGLVPGNSWVEGDLEFDVSADILLPFIYASRCTVVKTGAGPYVYTCTPNANALPTKTLSISIKRASEVFGYTGCAISSMKFSIDDKGILKATMSVIGSSEATQTALTATWPTTAVISAGMYNLQIPTSTTVFDADKFEINIEDNATTNPRIRATLGSAFTSFGESRITATAERDFDSRAEYDAFKAGTSKSISLIATQSASNIFNFTMPSAITSSYEINLGGQGDLVRASIEYTGVIDATGKHYQLILTTSKNIT